MDNALYATLTRQSGLMHEMRVVANNIANANTTGFRTEGMVFAEHISALGPRSESLSMATGLVRDTLGAQGAMTQTGGVFDLAIEGNGFFQVQTPQGIRLTRAGAFTPNEAGDLVTADGYQVLDSGGAPVFVPQGVQSVAIAPDGTLSADGQAVGQVGLVMPANPLAVTREAGTLFDPGGAVDPAENGRILQGYVEESNVNPIRQISRMIEVQRAYELGQSFMDKEDARIRGVIQTLGR